MGPVPPIPDPSVSKLWLWILGGVLLFGAGIGAGVLLGKQLYSLPSETLVQEGQSIPIPSPTPIAIATPAPDSTANWKTYENKKYGFSFKHPNLDEKCCSLAGAASDNPVAIITLADITTGFSNTDAPFDGLSVYIIPNENNLTFDQYIEKERVALFEQFKIMADPSRIHKGQVISTQIAGQPAISLANYSWDGIARTYFKSPNSKVIIEISKKEQSQNHFSSYDQILSTFKFLEQTLNEPTIYSPLVNAKVVSPLTIKGAVPSEWMFEGVFPVKLVDSGRKLVIRGQGKETVPSSWSEGKTVEFSATLTFVTAAKSGFIILENDNPSGLPENNKSFEIPINF